MASKQVKGADHGYLTRRGFFTAAVGAASFSIMKTERALGSSANSAVSLGAVYTWDRMLEENEKLDAGELV
jgi:hypothetical protein